MRLWAECSGNRGLISDNDETFIFSSEFPDRLWRSTYCIKWVPSAVSSEVKRQGREAVYWAPSSAQVNEWCYTWAPLYDSVV